MSLKTITTYVYCATDTWTAYSSPIPSEGNPLVPDGFPSKGPKCWDFVLIIRLSQTSFWTNNRVVSWFWIQWRSYDVSTRYLSVMESINVIKVCIVTGNFDSLILSWRWTKIWDIWVLIYKKCYFKGIRKRENQNTHIFLLVSICQATTPSLSRHVSSLHENRQQKRV